MFLSTTPLAGGESSSPVAAAKPSCVQKLDGSMLQLSGKGGLAVTQVDRLTSRSMILTLREVLTKRHCVLKARLEL